MKPFWKYVRINPSFFLIFDVEEWLSSDDLSYQDLDDEQIVAMVNESNDDQQDRIHLVLSQKMKSQLYLFLHVQYQKKKLYNYLRNV